MAFSEDKRSSVFLVLLSLIFISCWSGCWGALFSVRLREATVIASSTCNNTELCVFRENNLLCQQCSFNQHQPGFAVDGDRNTTWSSPPTSELSSGRAQLEIHLNKSFSIHRVSVLFGASLFPPHVWTIDYYVEEANLFIPMVVIIAGNITLCSNWSAYPTCHMTQTSDGNFIEIDVFKLFKHSHLDTETALQTSALKFGFLVPAPALQDPREEFYSVSEIYLQALCYDNITDTPNCQERTRLYRQYVESSHDGSFVWFLWQQSNTMSSLGTWYLDNVDVKGVFVDDFESRIINTTKWQETKGGGIQNVPCDRFSSQQVLFFSDEGNRTASTVKITSSTSQLNASFDLGFITSAQKCAEEFVQPKVELYTCDELTCQLTRLYSLGECGQCADEHLLNLKRLSSQIQRSLRSIPLYTVLVVINQSDFTNIQFNVNNLEDSYLTLLIKLVTTERVYGLSSQYPDGAMLPLYIVDINKLYNVTVLNHLLLTELLIQDTFKFSSLNVTANDVLNRSHDVVQLVSTIASDYNVTILQEQTEILLKDLSNLIDQLLLNHEDVTSALREGELALNILLRDYLDQERHLLQLQENTLKSYANLSRHTITSQTHAELSRNATDAIRDYKMLLPRVINISMAIIENATVVAEVNILTERLLKEIESLLILANHLVNITLLNIKDTQTIIITTDSILSTAYQLLQTVHNSISTLVQVITKLSTKLTDYDNNLQRHLPPNYPQTCSRDTRNLTCTRGEQHAMALRDNSTYIREESMMTVTFAKQFIDDLSDLPDIDFEQINRTAIEAIVTSNESLTILRMTDLGVIGNLADGVFLKVATLKNDSNSLLSRSQSLVEIGEVEYNRSQELYSQFASLQSDLEMIEVEVQLLEKQPNYTAEAGLLEQEAILLLSSLQSTNRTLVNVEGELPSLESDILKLKQTVSETERVLQETTNQVHQMEEIISIAQNIAEETRSGLGDIFQQNRDIISEIDSLLVNVADTHKLINKINSPARLGLNGSIQPYISLQPPPTVTTENEIQFESFDLYVYPIDYFSPALLFYAGPVVREGDSDQALKQDDYIAVTSESNNDIVLQWRIGSGSGNIKQNMEITAETEIFFSRVGSMFELRVGSGRVRLNTLVQNTAINNDSLLFRISEDTGFLIGGKPVMSSLALPNFKSYNSFMGLVNLLLFNGELWSLWNYRNRSDTDFLRSNNDKKVFRIDEAAAFNARILSSSLQGYSLSFDGDGYVKPIKFVSSTGAINRITFFLSIKSLEGMVAFLYDPITNVSLEIGLTGGNVIVKLSGPTFTTVEFTRPIGLMDFSTQSNLIGVAGNFVQYNYQTGTMQKTQNGVQFFHDTSRIVAWFGGVILDQLPEFLRPTITTRGYRGCVDIEIYIGSLKIGVFSNSFHENYLGSNVQKGMSGTCLKTTYSYEVGLNGSGFLAYSHPYFTQIVNIPSTSQEPTDVGVLSISFLPVTDNGSLFYALDTSMSSSVLISLQNSQIEVKLNRGQMTAILSSAAVNLMEWHHLLLEIKKPQQDSNHKLYIDDILVANSVFTSFEFTLNTRSSDPIYIGGVPDNVVIGQVPFKGCLRDLTYNLRAIPFLSEALSSYATPDGVTFNSCPFVPERPVPLVGLFQNEPEEKSCFSSLPATLTNTIGGFHTYTQALSYNILPLQADSWTLNFTMRQLSGDGHVITILSRAGVNISLSLASGLTSLQIMNQLGNVKTLTDNTPLPINTWIEIGLDCTVSNREITIVPSVGGVSLGSIKDLHSGAVFEPILPLLLGQKSTNMLGFVGCIKDLRINGNETGFEQEGLSTCITCYSQPVSGWGFSRQSYIMKSLSSTTSPPQYQISLQFQASKEHGLLLLLTTSSPSQNPILGIGFYEGELRVSNFSRPGAFIAQSRTSLCNPQNQSFHSLSIISSGDLMKVVLTTAVGDQINMTIEADDSVKPLGDINVYIGGLSESYPIPQDKQLFSFLISDFIETGLPPHFVGCLRQVDLRSSPTNNSNQLTDVSDANETDNVLVGFCPAP